MKLAEIDKDTREVMADKFARKSLDFSLQHYAFQCGIDVNSLSIELKAFMLTCMKRSFVAGFSIAQNIHKDEKKKT